MQAVAPVHLAMFVVAVVAIVAVCLLLRSTVAQRNKRRSKSSFVLGFACGLVAGPVLRRRRGRRALMVVARRVRAR